MDRRTFLKLAEILDIPIAVRNRNAPPTAHDHEEQKFLSENLVESDHERRLERCLFASIDGFTNTTGPIVEFIRGADMAAVSIPLMPSHGSGWQCGTDGALQVRGPLRALAKVEGLAFAELRGTDGLRHYTVFPFEVTP